MTVSEAAFLNPLYITDGETSWQHVILSVKTALICSMCNSLICFFGELIHNFFSLIWNAGFHCGQDGGPRSSQTSYQYSNYFCFTHHRESLPVGQNTSGNWCCPLRIPTCFVQAIFLVKLWGHDPTLASHSNLAICVCWNSGTKPEVSLLDIEPRSLQVVDKCFTLVPPICHHMSHRHKSVTLMLLRQ